ncbi:MAG: protease pro-enzyme activation domain-containing protein, partial [Thermoplasmata archaeon]
SPDLSGGPSLVSVHFDSSPSPLKVTHGLLPSTRSIWLTVTLIPSHDAELSALDAALITPSSPQFRHFLTENEFVAEFAPSPANVSAVREYFAGYGGVRFAATGDRLGLSFQISAGGADEAFHTNLEALGNPATTLFYTIGSKPLLPSNIAPMIEGVGGLANEPNSINLNLVRSTAAHLRAESTPASYVEFQGSQQMVGTDYTQLYGVSQLFPGTGEKNATFATNQAVDTLLWSGLNVTQGVNLPPWDPAAAGLYLNDTFPSTWPAPTLAGVPVTVDGVTPPDVGPPSQSLGDDIGESTEAYLDVEMAGSMAPGATVTNFYAPASVVLTGQVSTFADGEATALAAALDAGYGGKHLDAITNSFGESDFNDTLWNQELQEAATDGVSVFVSTGDTGDAPSPADTGRPQGQFTEWPSTSAFESFGDVAVGATTTTATGSGTNDVSFDPLTGSIATQSIWWEDNGPPNDAGSTGGLSSMILEPPWQTSSAAQTNILAAASTQHGITGNQTSGFRAVPDIAFSGNNTIVGNETLQDTLNFLPGIGGTSVASPLAAGFFTELAAVEGHSFGYITPEIYRIANYYLAHPGASGNPIEDVTQGANFVFFAEPGWDAGTGWGSLNASLFIAADENPTIANFGGTNGTTPPGSGSGSSPTSSADLLTFGLIGAILLVVVIAVIVVAVLPARRRRRAMGAPPMSMYSPYGTTPPPSWGPAGQPPAYPQGAWLPPGSQPPPAYPQ